LTSDSSDQSSHHTGTSLRAWQGLDAHKVFEHLQSPAANLPPASPEASTRSGSPKRHRSDPNPAPTEAPFVPTEQDERTQEEITRLVRLLYDRYPFETYTYLVSMIDAMQEQMEKDGKITAAENSQDHHFSPRSQSQSSQHDALSGDPDAMGSDEEGM
jgi:hypothetical protein